MPILNIKIYISDKMLDYFEDNDVDIVQQLEDNARKRIIEIKETLEEE